MTYSFTYSAEKNTLLKQIRGIDFENVIQAVREGKLLADVQHPGQKRTHQRVVVIEYDYYAYAISYVIQQAGNIFLKTIYPSRYYTKKYLRR